MESCGNIHDEMFTQKPGEQKGFLVTLFTLTALTFVLFSDDER